MSMVVDSRDIAGLTNSALLVNKDYNLAQADSVSYQLNYSDAAPAAKGFVAANVTPAADTITITSHGFTTGLKVALTGTNLPGGLSATNYWIVKIDANTIKLASSLANATATPVVPVDITSAGTTSDALLTPSALSQVVKLQQSNDGITFFDVSGLTVTVSSAGNTLWLVAAPPCLWHRVVVTPTTGALTLSVVVCTRSSVGVAY